MVTPAKEYTKETIKVTMGDKKSLYTGPPASKGGLQPPKKTLIEVPPYRYRTNLCVCFSSIMRIRNGLPRPLGRVGMRYTCVKRCVYVQGRARSLVKGVLYNVCKPRPMDCVRQNRLLLCALCGRVLCRYRAEGASG